jgi:hypothetical protein
LGGILEDFRGFVSLSASIPQMAQVVKRNQLLGVSRLALDAQ